MPDAARTADAVYLGGTVVTNDPERPLAEAVAVEGGRVLKVGTTREIEQLAGPATRRERVDGAFVLPGLVDAHAHLVGLGDALATLDLTGTRSYEEILERVASAARDKPQGWIVGRGWDQNDWADKAFPDGRRLEQSAPGRPVWLGRIDGHAGIASPAAMTAAEISRTTTDPSGGRVLRDVAGEPTGVLIDTATDLVERKIPPPAAAERRARLEKALQTAVGVGLTGVHDMGISSESVELYRELDAAGRLPLRVYAVLSGDDPRLAEHYRAGPKIGQRLTVRAVKFFADGALGSRGAALLAPYDDDPKNQGLLVTQPEALAAKVDAAVTAGFQPCVHAIGDRANRIVLDAFEAALRKHDKGAEVRARVEHAQLLAPADLPRFAALGVIASMQPAHATSDMPWAGARVGEERLRGAYAWRTLLDGGARLAFGSDFPVERPQVFEGLYAAVARADRDGNPAGGWRPEQRISFAEALAGFTSGSAYAGFTEDRRGRIRPGLDADFTIVDGELGPLVRGQPGADPRALLAVRIRATVVGGVRSAQVRE